MRIGTALQPSRERAKTMGDGGRGGDGIGCEEPEVVEDEGQQWGPLPGVPLEACLMVSRSWGALQSQLVSLANMAGSVSV